MAITLCPALSLCPVFPPPWHCLKLRQVTDMFQIQRGTMFFPPDPGPRPASSVALPAAAPKSMPRSSRVLTIASACSGLATENWALRHLLKKQFAHLWVCDSDADVQKFLCLNCPEAKLYSNTNQLLQGNGASVPDVLVAGCPCQPYSSQGLRQGSADPRSSALDDVLNYAAQKKPKILILENVSALAHATHKDTRKKIARILRPSYNLVAKKLNSLQFNVLQRRQRIYLVATLKSVTSRKVIVPDKARFQRKLPRLHKFLGLKAQPELPDVKTWCQTARSNYLAALQKYKCNPKEAARKDLIIDLASSKSRRASCMDIAPTITASHGASRAYFLTSTNCRCLSQLPGELVKPSIVEVTWSLNIFSCFKGLTRRGSKPVAFHLSLLARWLGMP